MASDLQVLGEVDLDEKPQATSPHGLEVLGEEDLTPPQRPSPAPVQPAVSPTPTPAPKTSPARFFQRQPGTKYEAVPGSDSPEAQQVRLGNMVPDAAVPALATANKYAVQPLERAAKKGGEIGSQVAAETVFNTGHPAATGRLATGPNQPPDLPKEQAAEAKYPITAGITRGVGEAAGSMAADPRSWPFFLSGGAAARPVLQQIISLGFRGMMTKSAVDAATTLHDNWDKLTPEQRAQIATQGAITGYMAVGGGHLRDAIGKSYEAAPQGPESTFKSLVYNYTGKDVPQSPTLAEATQLHRSALANLHPDVNPAHTEDATNLNQAWDAYKRTLVPPDPTASALAQSKMDDVKAARVAKGLPPEPLAPQPPAPPKQSQIDPDLVEHIGEMIAKLPPEQRSQGMIEAHGQLAQHLLEQGKIVLPNGQLEVIDSDKKASSVAQKIINDEVSRQDKAAETAAKENAKAKSQSDIAQGITAARARGKQSSKLEVLGETELPGVESANGNGKQNVLSGPQGQRGSGSSNAEPQLAGGSSARTDEPRAGQESSVEGVQPTATDKANSSLTVLGEEHLLKKGDKVTLPGGESGTVHYISDSIARVEVPKAGGGTKRVSIPPAKLKAAAAESPLADVKKSDLVFARHGSTKLDQAGGNETVAGWSNEPLDDRGKAAANKIAEHLKDSGVTKIVSSDLPRASQTADIVSKQLGIPVETDERLRPQRVPEIEGKKVKEIQHVRDDLKSNPDKVPQGGESYNQAKARQDDALAEIEKSVKQGEKPLVVTHSTNLEAALGEKPEPGGIVGKNLKTDGAKSVIGEPTAKPRTNGQPLEHGFDFTPAEDKGQHIRDSVQKDQGALPRGERRKVERTPEEQQTQTLFGQARKELGEDATSDQVMARVEELKKAPAEQPKFKHRSTQINIPENSEARQALEATRQRIADSDLAGKGKDIGGNHVTVRWGLKAADDDKLEEIRKYLSSVPPFEAKLGKTEKFEPSESSDGAAVIQAPVEAPEMKQIHDELAKHGDFTEPTFKEYKPHSTVAYVKPEKADRYVGMNSTAGKKFKVDSIAITDREGTQQEIKLEGKSNVEVKPSTVPVTAEGVKPVSQAQTGTREKKDWATIHKEDQAKRERLNATTYQARAMEVAERLRKSADALDKHIDERRREMTQNPTPKRMKEYRSRLHDATNLERVQQAMRALADAHEAGMVPRELAALRSKDEIHRLVYQGTENGGYYDVIPSRERYANKSPEAKKLQDLMDKKAPETSDAKAAKEKASQISQLEAHVQFQKLPGYFPTPKAVASRLLDISFIEPGMKVLEPSAGKGDIAELIRQEYPEAKLDVVEQQSKLREILKLKGFNVVGEDFLQHKGEYDRIIMNPPFEKGTDVEHVRHAYDLLKPGGRVIAIMSPHAEFASDKKSVDFRNWLDDHGGFTEKLPDSSFKESGTGAGSRRVVIDKPERAAEIAKEAKTPTKARPAKGKREEIQPVIGATYKGRSNVDLPYTVLEVVNHDDWRGKQVRARTEDGKERAFSANGIITGNDKLIKQPERREVISTAKPEYSSQKQVKGTNGNDTQLLTSSGERPAKYRVVEAADLTPSHNSQTFARNAAYPEGVQERAYDTSKEAQARVIQQTEKFNPDYVINTNPDAVNGPPIITPDGIVLGGNSRAMTIQRLYKAGRFMTYKQVLVKQADTFGLNKEVVRMMKEPVLVREVEAPKTLDEMRALGSELNKSMTGALGVNERAVSAGKSVSRETLNSIAGMIDSMGENASLRDAMRERGSEIVKLLVKDGAITERERPQFVDTSTGGLSEEGKTFVERALLGSVVDDPRLMDSTPKSVLNKLDSSLAALSSLAPRTDAYNILPLIRDALREHSEIASKGIPVEDHLSQSSLFGGTRNPAVDAIVRVLAEKPTVVKTKLRQFSQDANFDVQGQGMLALGSQPSPSDAFNAAFGTKLSDEELESAIIQSAQSDTGAERDGAIESNPQESPRDLQQPAPGETREGRQGTAEADRSKEKTKLESKSPSEPIGFQRPEMEAHKIAGMEAAAKSDNTPEHLKPHIESAIERLKGDSGALEPAKLAEAVKPVTDYLKSEIEFNKVARELHSGMYDLESVYSGEVLRAVQAIEKTSALYGKNLVRDLEPVYHHLEDPEVSLTPQQDTLLDDAVLPIMEKTDEMFKQLEHLLGTKDPQLLSSYVHRVVRNKGGWFDRIVSGMKKGTGRGNLLSKSAPQTKGRTMMAIESPDGDRRVISIKGGRATMFVKGEATDLGELKNAKGRTKEENETFPEGQANSAFYDEGKVVEGPDGYDWRVVQATTKEIESNTDIRYFHNALASALVSNLQVGKALRGAQFIESFKQSPEFKTIAFKQGKGNPPDGWKMTQLPQLRDYYFEPHTAEVLDWYASRIQGSDPGIAEKIGQFLRTSIFFNPLIHIPNITAHWSVERGVTGYNPLRFGSTYRSSVKAINAIIHQNQDFLDALDAGAALQSHREDTAKITQLFFEQLGGGLEKKAPWALELARRVGMSPVDLVKAIYRFSGKATWVTNDVAVLESAYEKVERGMPLKEALKETAKHIPDYRLPVRMFNSRGLAKILSNPNISMFMAYHYGAAKSYGEAAKSALGIAEPATGRSKAGEVGHGWELLATIGLLTFVVYPLIDKLLQEASGDENAHLRRAGPSTLPYNIYQAATKQKSAGDVIQSVATPAVGTKTAIELIANRDIYTGRNIYDPTADAETQIEQVGQKLAEAVSPIGQGTRMVEGGAEGKKRFVWSLAGVSFPKSRTERMAQQIALHKSGTGAETLAEDENYAQHRTIIDELRKGNDRPLETALTKGAITRPQAHALRMRARRTPLEDTVHGFSYSEVWKVYQTAKADDDKEAMRQLEWVLRQKRAIMFSRGRGAEVERVEDVQ